MTAEIAILNRSGVALAADSAVSVGLNKVFNSADKLFSLSSQHSVGIMIYGNANFMNVPWETVVSLYRQKLSEEPLESLEQYCQSFIGYLKEEKRFTSRESEKNQIGLIFSNWLENFLKELNQYIPTHFQHQPTEQEIQEVMTTSLREVFVDFNQRDYSEEFDKEFYEWFFDEYGDYIIEIFESNVNFELTEEITENMLLIAASLICRDVDNELESGIVFAGYGDNDIYPSLIGYRVGGIFTQLLKIRQSEESIIDDSQSAEIVPFAQQEMVHSFLSGIDPNIYNEINVFLDNTMNSIPEFVRSSGIEFDSEGEDKLRLLGDEIIRVFNDELKKIQVKRYVNPVIHTVASFPKEELSSMAEALVNLTSIKRKVTNQKETVGGPIDVAVISKSDGFIWVKRKQYYQYDLNHESRR
jgi:hypothetical protein